MYTAKSLNSQSSSIARVIKVGLLCSTIALTAGCGSKTIKPETHKPTKLVSLEQSVQVVNDVFSASLKNRSKVPGVKRLEVGFDGNQVVAVSNNYEVSSFKVTGERLWTTKIGDEILGGVSFDPASQTAVVTTKSAQVFAIDTSNGEIRWQKDLAGTVLSPALIHNNRVILSGNDGLMNGLSLQTGEFVWQFTTQTPSISVRGSAKPVLLDDKTVLIASADGRLHTVDVETGIPLWSRRVGIPSGASEIQRMTDVDGTPTIVDNQLYAISYSGQLLGVDLNSRQVMFLQKAASKNSVATIGNIVVATTLDGMVKAYHRVTGEEIWESDALAYRKLSNPVVINNTIAIGDLDGVVHFLSPQDGRIISRVNSKGPINLMKAESGYLMTQTESGQVNIWRATR